MAKPARHIQGGYCDPKKLPKGPNGWCLCRQCSTEVKPPRRTFCCKTCIDLWMVRTGSGTARYLKKRDKGICALCRLDCEKLSRELRKLTRAFWLKWNDPDRSKGRVKRAAAALTAHLAAFKAKHGIPAHRKRRLWDIDHIIPVAEGGGSCTPDNLRTLCIHCHQAETKKLMERLKLKRLAESGAHDGISMS